MTDQAERVAWPTPYKPGSVAAERWPTRGVMTAAELKTFHVREYGRDYRESDDGYGDMAAERRRGWVAISGWGKAGWDLGDWPYVVIYVRDAGDAGSLTVPGRPAELMTICEGDRTQYAFTNAADREAAIDYLFLWYSADEEWSPVASSMPEARAELDAGRLQIDHKYRGPFSWARCGNG